MTKRFQMMMAGDAAEKTVFRGRLLQDQRPRSLRAFYHTPPVYSRHPVLPIAKRSETLFVPTHLNNAACRRGVSAVRWNESIQFARFLNSEASITDDS